MRNEDTVYPLNRILADAGCRVQQKIEKITWGPEICFPIIGKNKTGAELRNEIRLRQTKSTLRVDLRNDDLCAQGNELKERGGILGGEADAAVGDGGAELGNIGRAVYIDESGKGVGVVRFHAVQSEDAGEDGIFPQAGCWMEPHGDAGAENGVQWCVFAVFGVDAEPAQRGAAAAFLAARAGSAGAARSGKENLPCGIPQFQPLLRDVDVNSIHYSLFT